MKSSQEYLSDVQTIINEVSGTITMSTVAEAKLEKSKITSAQKQLRQIKTEISQIVKSIRLDFKEKSKSAGALGGSVLMLFGKRGAAKSHQAVSKRNLNKERDDSILLYEKVKLTIDKAIVNMDRIKMQIDDVL